MSLYQNTINELLNGRDYDPRHIEAFMLLQHDTLDHLSREQMAAEVNICAACVDEGGEDAAELLAQSYGL